MGDTTERLTLTVDEAAAILGIGRGTAYEAVRTGQIPSIRISKRILIPRRSLELMLSGEDAELDNNNRRMPEEPSG